MHGPARAFCSRRGGSEVVSVRSGAVTHQFSVNSRAPLFGPFVFFQHQNRRAFAHHKAVPVPVKWPGCGGWNITSLGKSLHRSEPPDTQLTNNRLGSSRQHDVGFAPLNGAVGLADRMCARGAGGYVAMVGPFEIEQDTQLARGDVRYYLENEKRRNAAITFFFIVVIHGLDFRKSSHTHPHVNSKPVIGYFAAIIIQTGVDIGL